MTGGPASLGLGTWGWGLRFFGLGGGGGGVGVGGGGGGAEVLLSTSPQSRVPSPGLLQRPFDDEHRRGVDQRTIVLKYLRHHRGVGGAGFVLDGDEAHTFRRTGALANDHQAGHFHPLSVARAGEIGGAQHLPLLQLRAQMFDDVRTDGEAGGLVVGQRALEGCHLGQQRLFTAETRRRRGSSYILGPHPNPLPCRKWHGRGELVLRSLTLCVSAPRR